MSRSRWNQSLCMAAFTALVAGPMARAAVVFNDPFTDGAKNGGSDNSGMSWYDRSINSNLSVASDAVIGTGNTLSWTPNNTGVTARGYTGVLTSGPYTITNTNDFIELSFDFRFKTTSIAAGGSTTTPVSNASGITFGFYNSNGTTITADDSASQDDDFGYRAELGSGTTSGVFVGREVNSGAGGTGTTTTGDTATIPLTASTPVAINDFAKHTLLFRATRTATGIDFVVGYDGATVATATSSGTFFTSFDEIVLSQNGGNGFLIDNVSMNGTVPEPATAGLAGVAGGLLLLRRRRLGTR